MKFKGSFGSWLKQHRKALDLTQRELADQVACSVVTIRKMERDVCRPSKQVAERLADVLTVAPDDKAAFVTFARRMMDTSPALNVELTPPTPLVNLPPQSTPFIGRQRELAQIADRLADPACRLLTLLGPGGSGKTRLALQAAAAGAADFTDGVHFVPLAPVTTFSLLASAIGSALKFSFYGEEPPAVQLHRYLREKTLLLVLDNFEHLLAGTPLLIDLLSDAPYLKLLVTSRERLNVQPEWVFSVEGMDYPHTADSGQVESYA